MGLLQSTGLHLSPNEQVHAMTMTSRSLSFQESPSTDSTRPRPAGQTEPGPRPKAHPWAAPAWSGSSSNRRGNRPAKAAGPLSTCFQCGHIRFRMVFETQHSAEQRASTYYSAHEQVPQGMPALMLISHHVLTRPLAQT